jgi:hypothetical protein
MSYPSNTTNSDENDNSASPLYGFVSGFFGFRSLFNAGNRHGQQLNEAFRDTREGPSTSQRGLFTNKPTAHQGGKSSSNSDGSGVPFGESGDDDGDNDDDDRDNDCVDDADDNEDDQEQDVMRWITKEYVQSHVRMMEHFLEKTSPQFHACPNNQPALVEPDHTEWDAWLKTNVCQAENVETDNEFDAFWNWSRHPQYEIDRMLSQLQTDRAAHHNSDHNEKPVIALPRMPVRQRDGGGDSWIYTAVGYPVSTSSRKNPGFSNPEEDDIVSFPDFMSRDEKVMATLGALRHRGLREPFCLPEFWGLTRSIAHKQWPLSKFPHSFSELDMYEKPEKPDQSSTSQEIGRTKAERAYWRLQTGSTYPDNYDTADVPHHESVHVTVDTRSEFDGSVTKRTRTRMVVNGKEEVVEKVEKFSSPSLLSDSIRTECSRKPEGMTNPSPEDQKLPEEREFRGGRGWFWSNQV